MPFKKLFGGRSKGSASKEPELDPLRDLILSKLKVGYLLDYDLQTWQVTGYARYDFDGDRVDEWEIVAAGDKRFLEREAEEEGWSLAQKIPIGAIDGDVRNHIKEHEDPPDRLSYEGVDYYLDDSTAGHFYPSGEGEGQPLIKWEYVDKGEERFLTVEQWGENEFEASAGIFVEEYQFSNILPAGE